MDTREKDSSIEIKVFDVSEPQEIRTEREILREERAQERKNWIKTHSAMLFAALGILIVGLTVLLIYINYQGNNPLSRFNRAISKDFGTSFDFDVEVSEDGKPVMRYDGAIGMNRSGRTLSAVYQADYGSYSYTGAVDANERGAAKGSQLNGKWILRDCTESAHDFFDFDRDFSSGGFNAGAFLRFTGLTSAYSADELGQVVGVLKSRLSTDSDIAVITSSTEDGVTLCHYDINLYELFMLLRDEGAPLFSSASDYNAFTDAFTINSSVIQYAECTVDYSVDKAGYLTSFEINMKVREKTYGLSCRMSGFGEAKVALPDEFTEAFKETQTSAADALR